MIDKDQEEIIKEQIVLANENKADLTTFKIEDAKDCALAQQVVKDVSKKVREIEERRKRTTKPILEAKREVDALFKEWTTPLEAINKHLRKEIVAFDAREAEARKAAAEEAKKAALVEDDPEKVRALVMKSSSRTETVQGVSLTSKWVATVVDFALVPDQFKKIDNAALQKFAKQSQGQDEVPGVIFSIEKSVRA